MNDKMKEAARHIREVNEMEEYTDITEVENLTVSVMFHNENKTTTIRTMVLNDIIEKAILVSHDLDKDHFFIFNQFKSDGLHYTECEPPYSVNDPI